MQRKRGQPRRLVKKLDKGGKEKVAVPAIRQCRRFSDASVRIAHVALGSTKAIDGCMTQTGICCTVSGSQHLTRSQKGASRRAAPGYTRPLAD